jgi:hypothetical protein
VFGVAVDHGPPESAAYSTAYADTAAPPSEAGAVHDTLTDPSPDTPATAVGAPGVVDGTTPTDACDTAPDPRRFSAVTLNAYDVPFTRPVTCTLVAAPTGCWAAVVHDPPPAATCTTYPVIAEPPVAGAVHDTSTTVFPDTPVTLVGASGTVDGMTGSLAADTGPVPFTLIALTRKM